MLKKTLVTLAVASSVALSGCLGGNNDTGKNANPVYPITSNGFTNRTWPIFNPIKSELPIPNDLIFDTKAKDGTFSVPPDPTNPVITALNQLSGASTNAPIDIDISGAVDASTVDARSVVLANPQDPTSLMPNPNQDVFLIKLKYASGDPVTALTDNEPPTIPFATEVATGGTTAAAALSARYQSEPYTAKVLNLNGQTVLRILPLKPLDPLSRYVVVLTNGIKDASGNPLVGSPSYSDLASGAVAPENPDLVSVRKIIDGLWEPIASSYFQLTNSSRAALQQPALTDKNIVLSYSFTTSNDQKVLKYIAQPSEWFLDRLEGYLADAAVKAALAADPTATEPQLETAVSAAITAFPDANTQAALGASYSTACSGTTGPTALGCVAQSLASAFGGYLPTPEASTNVQFNAAGTTPASLLSAVAASIIAGTADPAASFTPTPVDVVQGTMTVPYYLGAPAGSDGTPITADSWVANDALATAMNQSFSALGLSIPQADPSVSTNVNYVFPFPKKRSDQTIPVLAMYPQGAITSAPLTTVIFQHGITTDRSAALTFGSALIEAMKKLGKNIAVVAIDQPLHGVVLTSQQDKLDEANLLLGQLPKSFTDGLTAVGIDPTSITASAVVDGSFVTEVTTKVYTAFASACSPANPSDPATAILQGQCGATAQSLLAGAVGLQSSAQHPGSIVPGLAHTSNERTFDFTADASGNAIPQVASLGKAVNKSGSLFINLKNFTNNRDNEREAVLDLLTLRKTIANMDLNGDNTPDLDGNNVYFIGHSLGAIDGGVFAAVANANPATELKGVDLIAPGGGIVRLLDNSPTFAPTILAGLAGAGLTTGDPDLETYFDVYQAAVDAGDPINFVNDWKNNQKPMLLTEFLGDQVIPNLPYPDANALDGIPERAAPLSGTEPLLTNSGSANLITSAAFSSSQPVWSVRFTKGTHGTPVVPLNADQQEAFAELVAEAAGIIYTDGAATSVQDSNTVKTQY